MINFLSKATNHFGKIFTLLGFLLHGFSQQVFCGEKEKIAYIDLVKRSFQEDELVQKTFSQPLELMGLEKSPLTQEIFQQKKSISNFCIFKPLLLKAAIHLFDDDLVNFRKKEMYLDFNENREEMIIDGEIKNNPIKFFLHVNNITEENIVENLKRFNDRKEKAHYFFKNFNTFAKNKNLCFIDLYTERYHNISTTKIFYNFKNFLGIFQENCGEYIEKYFSKDFFITSCRKLFPYFNDIECLKFFQLCCASNLRTHLNNIYYTLEQNKESTDLSHNSFAFMKTEKKFYEAFENLLIPLKSFFVFHYYNTSLPNSLPKSEGEEKVSLYLRKDYKEVKISKELVLKDMESLYIKKAIQAIYKIFFISFLSKDSSFKFLDKFDAASYNHFLFEIMNIIKLHLKKEKIELHNNIYTSRNFFNFAVCARSQFKYNGNTRNFISFFALKYFVGSEDSFDILTDKDDQFFQKIDESLEFLKIFSAPECSCIIFHALDKIKFLKKIEK